MFLYFLLLFPDEHTGSWGKTFAQGHLKWGGQGSEPRPTWLNLCRSSEGDKRC